jgi:hypothetical protein
MQKVQYRVHGTAFDGFSWHEPEPYDTLEEAQEQADCWAKHEPKVWVVKETITYETAYTAPEQDIDPSMIPA